MRSSSVPALERGLNVVELLAQSSEAMTLTQIAHGLGRKVTEIQRTVIYLYERDYILRDSLGGYRISSRLFELANQHPPFRNLLARAMPAMEDFAERTGESVHVSILSGDHGLVIGEAVGSGIVRISVRVGLHLSLTDTVSGRILLSGISASLHKAAHSSRDRSEFKGKKLNDRLRVIQRLGYDESVSSELDGVFDLGVPIKTPTENIIAALASTWLQSRRIKKTNKILLESLKKCAMKIQEEL
ncbi:MAG: IclR family transcriptional regulator C-terminal domain-containing protein [Chthoniobacterales bacterium]